MKQILSALTLSGLFLLPQTALAVPVFSSPECTVKGIIRGSQQRVENVHNEAKVFNDATLYVLEQDYSNETERAASQIAKAHYQCNIEHQDIIYQLRDDYVTFRDSSLEKKLEGQCVKGHAKLSDVDNTLGIWLYDVEVLNPEECMVTASE